VVQISTPGRQDQWLHTTAPQQAPKGGRVERFSVQDEVLNTAEKAVAVVGQIPCDLRLVVAVAVVRIELLTISWIRHRYMETPRITAAGQVGLGGALVFVTGLLIGFS
jgi:hypothetical protein